MRRMRWLLAAAVAALLATPAAGRVQANQSARRTSAESGVLRLGYIDTNLWVSGTLDPAGMADEVVADLYSGLVKLDDQYRVVPDLAQSLPTISADHLTYTFTLRPGLQFADGTPLTSQDVVYSIGRALSNAERSPSAPLLLGHIKGAHAWNAGTAAGLAGVIAPDPHTVRITLDRPVSYFLSALANPVSWVVKKGLAPGINLAGPRAQALTVASGPFIFGRPWRYRQELYLVPNPHWYGAAQVKLKELRYRFYADVVQLVRGYEAGQIDIGWCCRSLTDLDAYRKSHNPELHSAVLPVIDYLVPNLGSDALCKPARCAPFNDLHFRRALLYAIDRSTLSEKIYHGWEIPLCGLIPRGVLGYDPSLCSLTPYDPARARAELTLAKKDFGGAIPNEGSNTLIYVTGFPPIAAMNVALQGMWARVGIHIAINAVLFSVMSDLSTKNSTPFIDQYFQADYPDPQDFAETLLTKGSAFNIGNYDNPIYARLVQQGNATLDPTARERLYIQAQRQALEDVATIPLTQVVRYFLWRAPIRGYSVAELIPDYSKVSVG